PCCAATTTSANPGFRRPCETRTQASCGGSSMAIGRRGMWGEVPDCRTRPTRFFNRRLTHALDHRGGEGTVQCVGNRDRLLSPFPEDQADEGMHRLVCRLESVVGRQCGSFV